jgi:hypothetical protein
MREEQNDMGRADDGRERAENKPLDETQILQNDKLTPGG